MRRGVGLGVLLEVLRHRTTLGPALDNGSRLLGLTFSPWLSWAPLVSVSTWLIRHQAVASPVCFLSVLRLLSESMLINQPTVIFQDGEIVYPDFAYPLRNEIVPIWAAALMAFFIPFAVFLIVQIRARSFWDINNATIGLLYSLIAAAVFQVFIKWLIGGLRPHFLAVCKPVIPQDILATVGANNNGNEAGGAYGNVANGYRQIMFDRSICTGDKNEIDDSLESMPSGHTTAAFAGFVFLYLYLNAKLKVFSNYHPAMWKIIALYAPILGACLIGGSLSIDEYHNWVSLDMPTFFLN